MTNEKKEMEKLFVEQFLQSCGLNNEFLLKGGFHEKPDILLVIKNNGNQIGVEVTRYYKDKTRWGSQQRRAQSKQERLVKRAEELYLAAQGRNIDASVDFAKTFSAPVDESTFLNKLVEIARKEAINLSFEDSCVLTSGLPDGVEALYLYRLPLSIESVWTVSEGGWVAAPSISTVQEIIHEKDIKRQGYRQDLKETWLLIVADGRVNSSTLRVGDVFDGYSLKSDFDRTYFFSRRTDETVRLS